MAVCPRPIRAVVAVLALTASVFAHAMAPDRWRFDFDSFELEKPPPEFSLEVTGTDGPAGWRVKEDASSPSGTRVLIQTSADRTPLRFPLCVYDRLLTHNIVATVRFKPMSGSIAQAAGLVARFENRDNYWVLSADAVSGRIRLDKVLQGTPHPVASAPARVASGSWHALKLVVTQHHFEGFLDGERLVVADDMTLGEAGEVALWTKADSVIAFDDFIIEESDAGH